MRSVGFVLVALGAIVGGCGGSASQVDAGGGPADAAGADARADVPPDPAACQCQVDATGTLTLSWACYCGQAFAACEVPLAVPTNCATYERTDYPDCGLTALVNSVGPSADLPSVYDATGTLVGRASASDLSLYLCPSDPTTGGFNERAGRFPAATCHAVACGGCYAGPFPCPEPDGGTDAP
jgi:hypothetical protein